MKKYILALVSFVAMAALADNQYSFNDGWFIIKEAGDIHISFVNNNSNPGHVAAFGYYVQKEGSEERSLQTLTENWKGGEKVFDFSVNKDDKIGFWFETSKPEMTWVTSDNESGWFSFDEANNIATAKIYFDEGNHQANSNKMLQFKLSEKAASTGGQPLPGLLMTLTLGGMAVAGVTQRKRKASKATKA
jgi:hypothetical protein